jgi:hypothetical protein
MASKWPSPTNAQALAALTAFTEPVDVDAAIATGERSDVALAYYTPTGILPRMRLLAAGFVKKGDKYKLPSDETWWKRKYAYPLWPVLRAWLKVARHPSGGATHLDESLAAGDRASLSQQLVAIDSDLQALSDSGLLGGKPPYLIPSTETMPITNHAVPIGVITTCKDKRTGKMCWPVGVDGKKNPNCECSSTVVDPIKEIGDRTASAVLLLVVFLLLAKGK